MKVEYELTRDDWADLGEHCARTAPEWQRARHVGVVIGMLLILASSAFLWSRSASPWWITAGLVAAAAWGWYWPHHLVKHARAHMSSRQQLCLHGRHIMEVLASGLYARCDITESTVRWPGIRNVAQTATHVFIMLNDVQGYVVPKARVTDGDLDEFVRQLTAKIT